MPCARPGTKWVPFREQCMWRLEVSSAVLLDQLAGLRERQQARLVRESVDSGGDWGATLTPPTLRDAAMSALDEVKRRSCAKMVGPPTAATQTERTRALRKERCTKFLKTVQTGELERLVLPPSLRPPRPNLKLQTSHFCCINILFPSCRSPIH